MSRWIDADALEPIIVWQDYEGYITTYSDADIENAPSIDLVRCAECKHCVNGQCWKSEGLDKLDGNVADDDFCSRGERKENE